MRRRLAAVWFADIVGYTAVSSKDETTALELVHLLQDLATDVVEARGGRIVKFLGDGAMAEFPSAEGAVDAALELIRDYARDCRTEGLEGRLCVGTHLGELTVSGDGDLYGDVVNTAARLQGEAEPDEVLVSEDVWRQLKRRDSFLFDDRGERRLKGKDEPVRAFRATRSHPVPEVPPEEVEEVVEWESEGVRRLVVLPFRVLRPDPEVDFLAFGLPDAVASTLMGLESLVLRSPPHLEGRPERIDPREIAREAEVDLVLSGSVARVGDRVRVTAQLAEGREGTILWNQMTTVALGNLLEMQDDLTRRIVDSLAEPLTIEEREAVAHHRPRSARAYELYLRANEAAVAKTHWAQGVELYGEALDEDPHFAPAWARLGRCYRLLAKYGGDPVQAAADRRHAREAFEKALEIDPDHPLAHSLYAQFEVESGRPVEGLVRLLRRAARHPSEVDLFVGLIHACRYCGLIDASLKAHRRVEELDPEVDTSVAYTYLQASDPEAALAAAPPTDPAVIYALHSLGRIDEARSRFESQPSLHARTLWLAFSNTVFAAAEGDEETALEEGRCAIDGFPDAEGRYFIARCWSEVGALDEAVELLQGVVEDGFYCVEGLGAEPKFAPLRDRVAFGLLLERADGLRQGAREAFQRERGGAILRMEETRRVLGYPGR